MSNDYDKKSWRNRGNSNSPYMDSSSSDSDPDWGAGHPDSSPTKTYPAAPPKLGVSWKDHPEIKGSFLVSLSVDGWVYAEVVIPASTPMREIEALARQAESHLPNITHLIILPQRESKEH
jgi:hypothetical protein